MEKKKQILTPEQKERQRVYNLTYVLSTAQKERNKVTRALVKANRTPEETEEFRLKDIANSKRWVEENPEKYKASNDNWRKNNPDKEKASRERFKEKYPDYRSPILTESDLGYWAVYSIPNYNGTGDAYCGYSSNLYARMTVHRSHGRLNTESHRILQCFETKEQAMAFERIKHNEGYHGDVRTATNK